MCSLNHFRADDIFNLNIEYAECLSIQCTIAIQ